MSGRAKHFMASAEFSKRRGVKGQQRMVEVRYDDDSCTTVDEIITNSVHLETMSRNQVWMEVNGLTVWFHVERGAIVVTCEPDDCALVEGKGDSSERDD